ncbi:MAG: hypothetical protein ABSB32_08020 [Thermodesulfobacteriota bacterium]|jgi:hypothetical protein
MDLSLNFQLLATGLSNLPGIGDDARPGEGMEILPFNWIEFHKNGVSLA